MREHLDSTASLSPSDDAVEQAHILIADDHVLVADMLELFLGQLGQSVRVTKTASMLQALAVVRTSEDLTLALLDVHMPDMDGLVGLRHIRKLRPDLPVVMLSGDVTLGTVRIAADGGARGYIRKTSGAAAIVQALKLVMAGKHSFPEDAHIDEAGEPNLPTYGDHHPVNSLSPREREVMAHLVSGKSNKQIAQALGVELVTVSMHLTHIYRKLKVTSRTQAVRYGLALSAPESTAL